MPDSTPTIAVRMTPVDEGSLFACSVTRDVTTDLPADVLGEMLAEALQSVVATGRDPLKLRSVVVEFPKD